MKVVAVALQKGEEDIIEIRSLLSGKKLKTFNAPFNAIAFSYDGKYFITSDNKGNIYFYETNKYTLAHRINLEENGYILSSGDRIVNITSTSNLIAVAFTGKEDKIFIININDFKIIKLLKDKRTKQLVWVKFTKNNKYIIVLSRNIPTKDEIQVYDMSFNNIIKTIKPTYMVLDAEFHPQSEIIAISESIGQIHIWNFTKDIEIGQIGKKEEIYGKISFTENGEYICSYEVNKNEINIWRFNNSEIIFKKKLFTDIHEAFLIE